MKIYARKLKRNILDVWATQTSIKREETEKLPKTDIKYMGRLEIKRRVDFEQESHRKAIRNRVTSQHMEVHVRSIHSGGSCGLVIGRTVPLWRCWFSHNTNEKWNYVSHI